MPWSCQPFVSLFGKLVEGPIKGYGPDITDHEIVVNVSRRQPAAQLWIGKIDEIVEP